MNKTIIAFGALAAVLATGCKSDAQKMCDKMTSLAKAAEGEEKKMAEKVLKEEPGKCVGEAEKMQKESPEAFKTVSTCIGSADKFSAAMECFFAAAKVEMEKKAKEQDKK